MTPRLPLLAAATIATLALAATAVAAPSSAQATKPKPTFNLWVDKADGFAIALPVAWNVIPRTKTAIRETIAVLKGEKQTSLASAYNSVLASPLALSELPIYKFQAFLWPPLDSLIPTEVNVEVIAGTTKYTASGLTSDAREFASGLQGLTTTAPKRLSLLAGSCAFFSGVAGSGKTKTGVEYYFFAHKDKLYILSFTLGDAYLREAKIATELRSLAGLFSFKT